MLNDKTIPRALERHTLPRPRGLIECSVVADIGAGIRPMEWYRPAVHICVEPFRPYAEVLRAADRIVLETTADEYLSGRHGLMPELEAVYLLDVIEHMEKTVGERVLALALQRATVQVVVFTPFGFMRQTEDAWGMGGEQWQTHRSGWVPEDFSGWRIERRARGFFAMWEA